MNGLLISRFRSAWRSTWRDSEGLIAIRKKDRKIGLSGDGKSTPDDMDQRVTSLSKGNDH